MLESMAQIDEFNGFEVNFNDFFVFAKKKRSSNSLYKDKKKVV